MRTKFLSGILCLILGIAILLPAAKRLAHAFEHTEDVCNNPTSLHFHQTEADCEFQKFYPSLQFLSNVGAIETPQKVEFLKIRTALYIGLNHSSHPYFSLRAPPVSS